MTLSSAVAYAAPNPREGLSFRFRLLDRLRVTPKAELGPVARAILAFLTLHADKYQHSFPSIETLAKETAWHIRTVTRAVGELERAGFGTVERPGDGERPPNTPRSNLYCVHLPSSRPDGAPYDAQREAPSTAPTPPSAQQPDPPRPPAPASSVPVPPAAPPAAPASASRREAEAAILLTLRELEGQLGGFVTERFAQRLYRVGKAEKLPLAAVRAGIHHAALFLDNARDHEPVSDRDASELVIRYVRRAEKTATPPERRPVIMADAPAAPLPAPGRGAIIAGTRELVAGLSPPMLNPPLKPRPS